MPRGDFPRLSGRQKNIEVGASGKGVKHAYESAFFLFAKPRKTAIIQRCERLFEARNIQSANRPNLSKRSSSNDLLSIILIFYT